MSEQAPIIKDEMPKYTQEERDKELGREPKKIRKDFQNELAVQINRLMNFFKVEAADIHRATEVAFSTLSGWINNKVDTQFLDDNIKKVARFFNVSVDYLVFGTPVSDRDVEIENAMCEFEEKMKSA